MKPVPITKAEAASDIVCKLSKMLLPYPTRLPDQLRPVIKPVPGSTTNSLGMIFVPVPGTHVMICIHETRISDYMHYLKAAPGKKGKALAETGGYRVLWGWEDHPTQQSWDEAKAFCNWLSQKEGRKYRLPTDEEWSYAVGIGPKEKRKPETTPKDLSGQIKNVYPWGANWPPPERAGNYMDMSYESENVRGQTGYHADLLQLVSTIDDGFGSTAPVMSFSPNNLGIYDLGGNVEEWCEDWYDEQRTSHVTRGEGYIGSQALWDEGRNALLSSWREPGIYQSYGFRIVLELP